jgi:hypothetical protein
MGRLIFVDRFSKILLAALVVFAFGVFVAFFLFRGEMNSVPEVRVSDSFVDSGAEEVLNDVTEGAKRNVVMSGNVEVEIEPKDGWEIDEFVKFIPVSWSDRYFEVVDRYLGGFDDEDNYVVMNDAKPPWLSHCSFGKDLAFNINVLSRSETVYGADAVPLIYWLCYDYDNVPDAVIRGYLEGDLAETKIAFKKSGYEIDGVAYYQEPIGRHIEGVKVDDFLYTNPVSGNTVVKLYVHFGGTNSEEWYLENLPGGKRKILSNEEEELLVRY